MKHRHILKLKKRWLFFIPAAVLALYLIFAYNYFYFRVHSTKLDWPNNKQTYLFENSAGPSRTYVALGDSLTFGFGADNYEGSYTYQLARYLAGNDRTVKLKDYSYPGYKVADVLQTIDPAIAYKPDVITLFVGVNDTHKLFPSGNFKENYDKILSRLTRETKADIYVISLPYLGASSILLPPYSNYFNAKTREHNDVIKNLAQKYGVNYIDLYSQTSALFKKAGPQYSKDLYHPSTEGYKIWADIIENDIHR